MDLFRKFSLTDYLNLSMFMNPVIACQADPTITWRVQHHEFFAWERGVLNWECVSSSSSALSCFPRGDETINLLLHPPPSPPSSPFSSILTLSPRLLPTLHRKLSSFVVLLVNHPKGERGVWGNLACYYFQPTAGPKFAPYLSQNVCVCVHHIGRDCHGW